MELDQIKHLWEQENRLQEQNNQLEQERIHKDLLSVGQTSLRSIRRNIWLEIGLLLLLLGAACMLLLPYFSFLYTWEKGMLPLMGIMGMGFYSLKMKTFGQINAAIPLLEQIREKVLWVERYLTIYRITVRWLIPILGAMGVLYGWYRAAGYQNWPIADAIAVQGIWIVLAAVGYAVLAWQFSKLYIRRLYGAYFQNLKNCLEELEILSNLDKTQT